MSILLAPEVIVLFIEDFLLLVFNTIAAVIAYKICKNFNLNESSQSQYNLEKQSYLASYIIKFSLYLKIISIIFFIYTLDKLSLIIPGAMCAVGVTSASGYGFYLLLIKILNIYLYGFWILINNQDMKNENYPFTKSKFKYFLYIYVFFLAEVILQYFYFFDINPQEIVSCCSTVFNTETISMVGQITNIPNFISIPIFYCLFIISIYTSFKKKLVLNGIINFFFLVFSLITLTSFFGTYIYELPTHHCPLCILQKDYNFIGYFLYTFLIIGTFFGIANSVLKHFLNLSLDRLKISFGFNLMYVAAVTFYPIRYFLINGVWL
ncbi:MAG: hypothetical protein WAR79_06455 [Melioribacteraceae bacterium]